MNKNSIVESYVNFLYESDKISAPKKTKGIEAGDLEGPVDDIEPEDNIKNAELETPEVPEHLQGISEEGVRTINMKKLNAFDRLYNRAININEDFGSDDMSAGGGPEGDHLGGDASAADDDMGFGGDQDMGGDDDFGSEDDEVTFTLDRATAEKLHEVLGSVLGGGMGEDDDMGMGEDEDSDDEYSEYDDEEEPVTEEEIDAEEHGHALVDAEKLNKGMNKPNNKIVKGAVPNPGGKADTGTGGKKADGKLSAHNDKGESLQGKDNKVHSRNSNVGKFALED